MKTRYLSLLGLFAIGYAVIFAASVEGQEPSWSHKAFITFSNQVEIPGRLLPPGTYVFKLMVPELHVAQVLSADESEAFGTFFTLTADRRPGSELTTDVKLEPRQKGSVRWDRVVAWFSPGEPIGDQIVYDKYKPVEPGQTD